jgi:hypothetical protein
MFDPQPHLIKLPRKVKDKATGTWATVYDDYLEVKWRPCRPNGPPAWRRGDAGRRPQRRCQ